MKFGEGETIIDLVPRWGSTFYLIAVARTMWDDAKDGPFMDWTAMMMSKDYAECVAIFINKFGDRVTVIVRKEEEDPPAKLLLANDTP